VRILVTGAAGYIGSVLCPQLLKEGHEVIAIDNFMYNQSSLLDSCHYETLTIVRGDVRDEALISKYIKNADIILPLACLTGAPICTKDPIAARTVNLDAVKMILSLRSKKQRIIYPTTNSGYGVGQKDKFCDENTPLNPVSLYGQLKTEAETAVLQAGNSITLRLATVFGASPRMRLDLLVNDFTYRAVYDRFIVLFEAHFKRNYIHIRDIARVFIHCLNNFESMKGQPYNVGLSDCNISKRQLCEEIKKYVPQFHIVESEIGQDPDKRDYIVSNEKIESAGFKPKFSLEFGIKELIKAYNILKRNQYANV
jgi:nucleoside-diphosphate-sugar epimerase